MKIFLGKIKELSQKWKCLQTQVARIKKTVEKVLDEEKSLGERICTLFRWQTTTTVSIVTTLSITISTIVLAITVVFG